MTPIEQHEEAQRRLSIFIREIKHYRALWGPLPPDKTVFMNAWRATREKPLSETAVQTARVKATRQGVYK